MSASLQVAEVKKDYGDLIGKPEIASFAAASTAYIPADLKKVRIDFYAPNYSVLATLVGGANYKRVPSEPSHALKFSNGGWWEIDEPMLTPEMAGAIGDGTTRDDLAIEKAIVFLDSKGGGNLYLMNKRYLCKDEIELPCGVHLLGPGELCFDNVDGNGIYCSTNVARKAQFSNIKEVIISRKGSNGGKGIYTRDNNAPFQTQSSHWHIEKCWFLQTDAQYTYPPSTGDLQTYAWATSIRIAQSNGTVIRDNDILGNYDVRLSDASQSFKSIGIYLGTEPSNTGGIIATDIGPNRIWYHHTPLYVGEDVLAFWFHKNECIKCFRGVYAPADSGGDGVVSQADTRIFDNYITTSSGSIELVNRQLLHIDNNHLNSDPAYYDNGNGWNGLRLENCVKFHVNNNTANMSAEHHDWLGNKRAFSIKGSQGGEFSGNKCSGYINDMFYMDTCTYMQFNLSQMSIGASWLADSKAGYAFLGTNTEIQIGATQYVSSEPVARYRFDDSGTTIESLSISQDRWVVPGPTMSAVPVSGVLTVDRMSVAVTTTSAPQTVTSIVGTYVRNGCRLRLRPSATANALTLVDGGNLRLAGNFVSTSASNVILLEWDATFNGWVELSRSLN